MWNFGLLIGALILTLAMFGGLRKLALKFPRTFARLTFNSGIAAIALLVCAILLDLETIIGNGSGQGTLVIYGIALTIWTLVFTVSDYLKTRR